MESAPPPVPHGTMKSMGRLGYFSCAGPSADVERTSSAEATTPDDQRARQHERAPWGAAPHRVVVRIYRKHFAAGVGEARNIEACGPGEVKNAARRLR